MRNAAKSKPRTAIRTPKSLKRATVASEQAITRDTSLPEKIEKLLLTGDLKELAVEERLIYVNKLCKSLGLNPLTQPFQYLVLQGRMVLYATRTCTEQLRKIHGVSVTHETRKIDGEHCIVDVEVQDRTGRLDTGTGVVWVGNMKGNDYANALMKASTKAKRRATLSIVGLGFLDESELDTLQGKFKMVTPGGRIIDEQTQPDPDAENPYLQRYLEREKKELEKLTPAQRAIVEYKMKEGDALSTPNIQQNSAVLNSGGTHPAEQHAKSAEAEPRRAEGGDSLRPFHSAEMPTASIPCLFYQYFPESNSYKITGDSRLMTEHMPLLKSVGVNYNPISKGLVATAEQLGVLLSRFENLKVPLRELKNA